MTRQDFIYKYSSDVIDATCGTNLFPSVKMAQMIIESADGNGVAGNGITFVQANNAFGIKEGIGWSGPVKSFSTPNDANPVSVFRVYPSIKDSIVDHTYFLEKNSRYKNAGVFDAKTPEEQIKAIANAGYAESPTYASAIIKIINDYNLKDLDAGCETKKIMDIVLIVVLAFIIYYIASKIFKSQDKVFIVLGSILASYLIYTETPIGSKIYNTVR